MIPSNIPCPYCKTAALYITATTIRCQRCDNYVHRSYVNMMTRQHPEAAPPPSPAVIREAEPEQLSWLNHFGHLEA